MLLEGREEPQDPFVNPAPQLISELVKTVAPNRLDDPYDGKRSLFRRREVQERFPKS